MPQVKLMRLEIGFYASYSLCDGVSRPTRPDFGESAHRTLVMFVTATVGESCHVRARHFLYKPG
jgi:hypothetical protein